MPVIQETRISYCKIGKFPPKMKGFFCPGGMMGLDFVEVVMEIENRFGITIKYEETGSVRSVGDLVRLIQSRVDAARILTCPNLANFHVLRRLVRDVTGQSDQRIRPSQRIDDHLSLEQRQRLWKRLPEILGTFPHDLRAPRWVRRFLLFAWFCIFITAIGYSFAVDVLFIPIAVLVSAFIAILLFLFGSGFRSDAPRGWETFGDVTKRLTGTQMATKNLHLATEGLILSELQKIFSDVIGVSPKLVVTSALLKEDLRMD